MIRFEDEEDGGRWIPSERIKLGYEYVLTMYFHLTDPTDTHSAHSPCNTSNSANFKLLPNINIMSPNLAQASLVLLSLSSLSLAYTPSSNEKRNAALSHHHTFARRQEGLGAVQSPGGDFSGLGSVFQIVGDVGMGMKRIVKKAHLPGLHGQAKSTFWIFSHLAVFFQGLILADALFFNESDLLEFVPAAGPIAVPVNAVTKTHSVKHHKHHHSKTAHHAKPTAPPASLAICPVEEVFNSTALWFEATGQSSACGTITKYALHCTT